MYWKSALGILLLALTIRVAAGCWWQDRLPQGARFGFPDSETYWELARAVADGRPLEMNPERRVFRTPGYPAVLAAVFWLGGPNPPVLAARILGAILGVAAVGGVMILAGLAFDRATAVLAGVVAAVYPGAVAMSVFVLSEAPFCPLMLAQLICWTRAWQADDSRRAGVWALAGGGAAGLATLTRPSWLLFTPFAIVVGLLVGGARRRVAWMGLCGLASLSAVMTPWWVRNWRVTGEFVPTTLQVGESLYDGLNPRATGASDMRFVDDFRADLRREDAARSGESPPTACFEARLDRRMRDAAIVWALRRPADALRLAGVKFRRIWNVWPNEPSLQKPWFQFVLAAAYVPVVVLALAGIWHSRGCGWPCLLWALPAVYFTGLHMVFVGSIRYRQPAMLALIVPAAGLAMHGWRTIRARVGQPASPV